MANVTLQEVVKRYGDVVALQKTDLEIREGEFLTLLGPSGCGKTTTLRLIAGFVEPSEGCILLGEEDVTRLPPQHRQIGMVFQDYALFPHMTIADNIAFGLVERGYGKQQTRERVAELLSLIRLPDVGERYPSEVSGGQQQRIAVARAVAYPPRVLLMDEPLGALDLKLREAMQEELRRIQQELGITTVYVTHDQTEAMNMSDRIVVMNLGRIEQIGSAEQVYTRPATRFVADFVGKINLLDGTVAGSDGGFASIGTLGITLRAPIPETGLPSGTVTLAVRPEHMTLRGPDDWGDGIDSLSGSIVGRTFAGNLIRVTVAVDAGPEMVVEARPHEADGAPGDRVRIGWNPQDAILLTA